jgi:hypothetical protein
LDCAFLEAVLRRPRLRPGGLRRRWRRWSGRGRLHQDHAPLEFLDPPPPDGELAKLFETALADVEFSFQVRVGRFRLTGMSLDRAGADEPQEPARPSASSVK